MKLGPTNLSRVGELVRYEQTDVTPFSGTLIAFPFVVCLVVLERLFRCNEPGEKLQGRSPPLKIVITIVVVR